MLLKPLDVIWIPDGCIRPPGPKMIACVQPELGFFFRINTKRWPIPVKLEAALHPFLSHDSYLECGEPLCIDDYMVEQALAGRGVIGRIDASLTTAIYRTVANARTITEADKEAIRHALGR